MNLKLFSMLAGIFVSGSLYAQTIVLTGSEIPDQISAYVSKNFPGKNIENVFWDNHEYEVKLDDRTELEFEKNFSIKEIESDTPLPQTVVPVKIWKFVTTRYPKQKIRSWKILNSGQEIELNNDIDLFFDLNGNFIRIDN